jgi:arylsulfatase A-like enzyme
MDFFISGGAVPELRRGLTDAEYPVAQYDAEIAYADERFGEVLHVLSEEKVLDDTLIIFTSDHGEAMNEHGVYYDHMDAYEQVTHVPLVIRYPERVKQTEIGALVQHIDFAPTILEAFGVDCPPGFEGRSLWPLLEGKQGKDENHYDAVFSNHGLWSAQRAMRTREWSLVRTIECGMLDPRPPFELFHRSEDPAEARDVAGEFPDVAREMEVQYLRWMEEHLGSRPDPLRVAASSGEGAWESARALYERHLADHRPVTPKDRAEIDDEPGKKTAR